MRKLVILSIALVLSYAAPAWAQESRFALIIANQEYADAVGPLNNPHKDAAVMAQALRLHGLAASNITVLKDAANDIEILLAVEAFAEKIGDAGPGALGFFYYSGHGVAREGTRRNFF